MFNEIGRGTRITVSDREEGGVPLITAGEQGQGITEYIKENKELFNEDSITIDMFGNTFYRGYEFFADDNIIIVRNSKHNRYVLQYICGSMQWVKNIYSYSKQFRMKELAKTIIELPVLTPEDTEPYWDYMAYYIHNIQQQYADQLESKSEYELDLMCQILGVTRDEIAQKVEYKQPQYTNTFKVDELFEGYAGKRVKKGDWEPGNIPYVTATVTNNGIDGYIGNPIIVKENLLTVNFFGDVFYQEGKVSFKDGTYGLKLRNKIEECKAVYLGLATHIQKQTKQMGSYDDGLRLVDIKNIILELPVLAPNSKQIDWDAIRHVAVGGGSTIWQLVKRYATEILR